MTRWLRALWSRALATVTRDRLDREFDEELATHFELLIDYGRRRGLSEAEARRQALVALGRPDVLREAHREQRGVPLLDVFVQDLRYAVRLLRKSPVFAVTVTLTLALGIGANTALFSLVDNLLLRSLPVRDPERLVELAVYHLDGSRLKDKPAAPMFDRAMFAAVRAEDRVVEDVVGFMRVERPKISIDGVPQPEREVDIVSAEFFGDLGVPLVIGRSADESDGDVAVISERWWRSRFGGSPEALGRALSIDGHPYTIIGIAPLRFHGFEIDRSVDAWIGPASVNLMMFARLRPGVTRAQAEAALHPLLLGAVSSRDRAEPTVTVARPVGSGISDLRSHYSSALLALMGLVTLVLLATCANVGNLIILRNAARQRELMVRAALGAGRSRLIIQSLFESTLLAAAGCLAGLFLAGWGVSIIVSLLPLPAPPAALTFYADARVVGFAAGVSVLTVLLYGLGPAWRHGARRTSISPAPFDRVTGARRRSARGVWVACWWDPGGRFGAPARGRGAFRADAAEPDSVPDGVHHRAAARSRGGPPLRRISGGRDTGAVPPDRRARW